MLPTPREPVGPDLLQPSLQRASFDRPIWSVRAGFFTSFFGGLYAAALFGLFNAARMRRLKQDAWLCVAAALLWSGFIWWATRHVNEANAPAWLSFFGSPTMTVRRAGNACGLLLFGLLYARQRALYRAYTLSGQDHPNPWPLGLGSVAAAMALTFLFAMLGGSS